MIDDFINRILKQSNYRHIPGTPCTPLTYNNTCYSVILSMSTDTTFEDSLWRDAWNLQRRKLQNFSRTSPWPTAHRLIKNNNKVESKQKIWSKLHFKTITFDFWPGKKWVAYGEKTDININDNFIILAELPNGRRPWHRLMIKKQFEEICI